MLKFVGGNTFVDNVKKLLAKLSQIAQLKMDLYSFKIKSARF